MTLLRTINHPDVQIRELDVSQYASTQAGTYCAIAGFTDKGQELDPYLISSIEDYEATFGQPTNEAERYHYYASKEVIRNGGSLIATKLPYNNTISTNYKAIGITVGSEVTITSAAPSIIRPLTGSAYNYTKYSTVTSSSATLISTSNYDVLAAGGSFPAGLTSYNFVLVNESKEAITGPNSNAGIFAVIVDPIDAMNVQRILSNPLDSDVMDIVQGINSVASTDFNSVLTGQYYQSSFSKDVMKQFPTIEFLEGGDSINQEYSNYIGIVICNTSVDTNAEGKLNTGIVEAFVGSIHKDKRNPATGQSVYIADIINATSNYVKMYRNETISSSLPAVDTTILYKASSSYPLLGFATSERAKIIKGANIVNDLKTTFEKLSNINEIQVDLVIDAGLSTIAQFTDDVVSGTLFDPVIDVDANDSDITSSSDLSTWRAIVTEMEQFCSNIRKDCMLVYDSPRHLVLLGNQKYIRKTAPSNTFSNTIGKKLKYITGINSSYAASYVNWFNMLDGFSGINFWIPETIKIGGVYCYNDRNANIWDAPAGLTRGIITGVSDLAFNPNSNEQDQLYTKSLNYAVKYPLEGFIVQGQRTSQVKPSAFDRVNVRRLFLRLERMVYNVSRYFVYEPNNLFTRRRLVDTITPIFQSVKTAGGIYDYRIVCDTTNNTSDVIDNNELKVAILVQPVKTAEFILVDFVATRTNANFDEIIQGLV